MITLEKKILSSEIKENIEYLIKDNTFLFKQEIKTELKRINNNILVTLFIFIYDEIHIKKYLIVTYADNNDKVAYVKFLDRKIINK